MSNEVTIREGGEVSVLAGAYAVQSVLESMERIKALMRSAMQEGVHFGRIPGYPKPVLLKPGAQMLCLTFRLSPSYETVETYDGKHLTVKATCTLTHITSGQTVAHGSAVCSTKESKFRYRNTQPCCPKCGAEKVRKGAPQYGGGYFCDRKNGGCGAKFQDRASIASIESQKTGKTENENPEDLWNTVMKQACKRALTEAVLTATASGDLFTDPPVADDEPGPVAHPAEPPAPSKALSEAASDGGGSTSWDAQEPLEVVDLDAREVTPEPKVQAGPQGEIPGMDTISEKQRKRLYAICKASGWQDDVVKEKLKGNWGLSSTKDIKRSDYDGICLFFDSLKGAKP